jgi:hypothetical protein
MDAASGKRTICFYEKAGPLANKRNASGERRQSNRKLPELTAEGCQRLDAGRKEKSKAKLREDVRHSEVG